ncbi:hypothetical protein J5N97_028385 [Dioscorea zingiberensis]|uniref:Sulfotransferase n=1 Tax=Dioscorea zingiberensis TaxID=325984 RepID=A0A9D5BYW5_9LILI|nr:hypothetical protein J5N97_028385 [Dioscorea zingiberensis]
MEFPLTICFKAKNREEEEQDERIYKTYEQLILTLPDSTKYLPPFSSSSMTKFHQHLRCYHGFWFRPEFVLLGAMAAQDHFVPRSSDILICTPPKVGTTWLKALAFATLNRNDQPCRQSLLLSHNPHICVPSLEYNLYGERRLPELTAVPSPRLLSTHIPYQLFPSSWVSSGFKIVYLCRNPKDTFVSYWHFINKITGEESYHDSLDDVFNSFLKGVHLAGPLWDHVLGYWNASLVNPHNVLFMRYEELKSDPFVRLRRLAEFMQCPFSEEEERQGVLEKILDMCSLESMRNLDVNKNGHTIKHSFKFKNDAFFRKGKVGDWVNFLTPEMAERLDQLMEQKLHNCGLSFND